MERIVTVDYLLNLLQKVSKAGKGDMQIKCKDNFLHEDEISINYLENEIEFRGYLFNFDISKRINKFCSDINRAKSEFYGIKTDYEESEE